MQQITTKFDAYTMTTDELSPEQAFGLVHKLHYKCREGRGFHRFEKRIASIDGSGSEVAAISYGGEAHGNLIMLEVKGSETPKIVETIREREIPHYCTRMDSCIDYDEEGAFEGLLKKLEKVKFHRDIFSELKGDWHQPQKGRTYMMGSPKSAVRVRLYDKGRQKEYLHMNRPNWARLEVQVRPINKERKAHYSALNPDQAWGASRWSREIAEQTIIGKVDAFPSGTVYRLPDTERSFRAMAKQYRNSITQGILEQGMDCYILNLAHVLNEERQALGLPKLQFPA